MKDINCSQYIVFTFLATGCDMAKDVFGGGVRIGVVGIIIFVLVVVLVIRLVKSLMD